MSDSTQGPGWWQASDGKWYPPEEHPDYQAPTQAMEATPPPTQAMPAAPVPPPPGPPPTAVVPMGPLPGGPPPGPPGAGRNNQRWIIIGVLAAVALAIVLFLLLRGGDDKKVNAASGSSSSSASTSSESSSSSSSSSRSSSSSSSSSTDAGQLSKSEIQQRLIKAKDIGADFTDSTFKPDSTTPTPCGGQSVNAEVPPDIDVGNDASNGTVTFEEEVTVYGSEGDAHQALTLIEEAVNCPSPTVRGGGPLAVSGPNDVTSDLTVPVDEAVEFDVQTEEAQGKIFVVRIGNAMVSFAFIGQNGADTSKLPAEIDLVNKGLERLVGG